MSQAAAENRSAGFSISREGLSLYWLALGCLLAGPWADTQTFVLDRSSLENWEVWRIWTGQLVHITWPQLALNMVGLLVLQQLFGTELKYPVWMTGFIVISAGIGFGWVFISNGGWLPLFSTDKVTGFSGLLHGLFALGACLAVNRDRLLTVVALMAVGGKILWEQFNGAPELTTEFIGTPVAIDIHLYGFISGLVLGGLILFRR